MLQLKTNANYLMNLISKRDFMKRNKFIKTLSGDFKLRKNGRVRLLIGHNNKKELIRCTPLNNNGRKFVGEVTK